MNAIAILRAQSRYCDRLPKDAARWTRIANSSSSLDDRRPMPELEERGNSKNVGVAAFPTSLLETRPARNPSADSACVHGAPPLCVQPDEDPQRAQLDWPRRKYLEAPKTGVVYGRSVCRPYHPGCSDRTSDVLFPGNAESMSLATSLVGGLGDGRVRRLLRQVKIAVTSLVPVAVVALREFGHSLQCHETRCHACY